MQVWKYHIIMQAALGIALSARRFSPPPSPAHLLHNGSVYVDHARDVDECNESEGQIGFEELVSEGGNNHTRGHGGVGDLVLGECKVR